MHRIVSELFDIWSKCRVRGTREGGVNLRSSWQRSASKLTPQCRTGIEWRIGNVQHPARKGKGARCHPVIRWLSIAAHEVITPDGRSDRSVYSPIPVGEAYGRIDTLQIELQLAEKLTMPGQKYRVIMDSFSKKISVLSHILIISAVCLYLPNRRDKAGLLGSSQCCHIFSYTHDVLLHRLYPVSADYVLC